MRYNMEQKFKSYILSIKTFPSSEESQKDVKNILMNYMPIGEKFVNKIIQKGRYAFTNLSYENTIYLKSILDDSCQIDIFGQDSSVNVIWDDSITLERKRIEEQSKEILKKKQLENAKINGTLCPICNSIDKTKYVDTKDIYGKVCSVCEHYIDVVYKNDFVQHFACPECNCFEGRLEENSDFLAIRCQYCGKQVILLEKKLSKNTDGKDTIKNKDKSCPICKNKEWDSDDHTGHLTCKKCGYIQYMHNNKTQVSHVSVKEPVKPKCPKCGGTEFTPVRKKWSLLTGFATNKVELVCNNCGTKKPS